MPAAGRRYSGSGALSFRGLSGYYWSSSENGSDYPRHLIFVSGDALTSNYDRLRL